MVVLIKRYLITDEALHEINTAQVENNVQAGGFKSEYIPVIVDRDIWLHAR